MATKTKTLYMVHCTSGLCDYNTHHLFNSKDEAVEMWNALYKEHSEIYMEKVYFEDLNNHEYYYEDDETNVKLYITEHEL